MEKFYLEEPNIERKEEVREFIEEFFEYNSKIAGVSGLDKEYMNYEEWLQKIKLNSNPETCPSDVCCGIQYFLIRESDNKLVGMINLRWNLNEWMLKNAGHIGYCVRPTERQKGYNKIGLYLNLLKARELGLDKVLLVAADNNLGSVKTIEALGGVLENKVPNHQDETIIMGRYWIDVEDSIQKHFKEFKEYIKR